MHLLYLPKIRRALGILHAQNGSRCQHARRNDRISMERQGHRVLSLQYLRVLDALRIDGKIG
jgi:hypothetical protein